MYSLLNCLSSVFIFWIRTFIGPTFFIIISDANVVFTINQICYLINIHSFSPPFIYFIILLLFKFGSGLPYLKDLGFPDAIQVLFTYVYAAYITLLISNQVFSSLLKLTTCFQVMKFKSANYSAIRCAHKSRRICKRLVVKNYSTCMNRFIPLLPKGQTISSFLLIIKRNARHFEWQHLHPTGLHSSPIVVTLSTIYVAQHGIAASKNFPVVQPLARKSFLTPLAKRSPRLTWAIHIV